MMNALTLKRATLSVKSRLFSISLSEVSFNMILYIRHLGFFPRLGAATRPQLRGLLHDGVGVCKAMTQCMSGASRFVCFFFFLMLVFLVTIAAFFVCCLSFVFYLNFFCNG